jgi:hypothetical protein
MNDKQKIEEMARDFGNIVYGCRTISSCCKCCTLGGDCQPYTYAKIAYNAGYRKESDVVKEVLEKVMSFTAEDEVGLKYLIRNLAREYGVELSGKLIKMRAN